MSVAYLGITLKNYSSEISLPGLIGFITFFNTHVNITLALSHRVYLTGNNLKIEPHRVYLTFNSFILQYIIRLSNFKTTSRVYFPIQIAIPTKTQF